MQKYVKDMLHKGQREMRDPIDKEIGILQKKMSSLDEEIQNVRQVGEGDFKDLKKLCDQIKTRMENDNQSSEQRFETFKANLAKQMEEKTKRED